MSKLEALIIEFLIKQHHFHSQLFPTKEELNYNVIESPSDVVFEGEILRVMYLGMDKAKYSLFWTVINELICAVAATYLLGFVLNWGLYGIWWGFVLGRGIASICNFIFSRFTINRLIWIRKRTSL